MSANFCGLIKGVKYRFALKDRTWSGQLTVPRQSQFICALASLSKGLGLGLQSLLCTKAGGKPCFHCEEQRFWLQKAGLLWPAGHIHNNRDFPSGSAGNEPVCQCRRCKKRRFNPWVGKIPWSRKRQATPVFLPGKSHGRRSLVGCIPWGRAVLIPACASSSPGFHMM